MQMPKGFDAIKKRAEKVQQDWEKRPSILYLSLPSSGDAATVRFLEQGDDVFSYYVHEVGDYKTKIPCLDQEDEGASCPGCTHQFPRKLKGLINVIWRNAPVYERDEDDRFVKEGNNKIVKGHKDQIAVWEQGVTVFNALGAKDVAYKGISSRDFVITRSGVKRDTSYSIEPADVDGGPQPPSDDDKKLAKDKYDLEDVARFVDEETFNEIIQRKLDKSEETDRETADVDKFLDKVSAEF
jgi:hypothetical protein